MCCTGFLPVTKGDVIQFTNVTIGSAYSPYAIYYNSSGEVAYVYNLNTNIDHVTVADGVYSINIDSSSYAYVRFTMNVIDSNSIFVKNESLI